MTTHQASPTLRRALTLAMVACAAALGACSSPARSSVARWESGYQAKTGVAPGTPVEGTSIKRARYELLAEGKVLAGYEAIGESRFRDEQLKSQEFDPDSSLASLAQRMGATLVLVGEAPAGQEPRTRFVRGTAPGDMPPPGEPSRGGSSTEMIPVEMMVDVYDYLAVFCREVKP